MPDLADLDHTWAQLEARADQHPLADMTIPPMPVRTPRRLSLVVTSGLTVAAVAVGAVVLGTRSPASRSVAPPARSSTMAASAHVPSTSARPSVLASPWAHLPTGHYLVRLDRLPGYRFTSVIGVGTKQTSQTSHDRYQEVQFVGPQGGFVVKINETGTWQPTGGRQVTLADGQPARLGRFLLHPEIPGHPVPPRFALAWQFASGTWATLASTSSTPITLATARAIEGKLDIGSGRVIPNPPPQDRHS